MDKIKRKFTQRFARILEFTLSEFLLFGSIVFFGLFYSLISQQIPLKNLLEFYFSNTETFCFLGGGNIVLMSIFLIGSPILELVYHTSVAFFKFRYAVVPYILTQFLLMGFTLIFVNFINPISYPWYIVIFITILETSLNVTFKYFYYMFARKNYHTHVAIIGPRAEAVEAAQKFFQDKSHFMELDYIIYEENKYLPNNLTKYLKNIDCLILTSGLYERNKDEILSYVRLDKKKQVMLCPKNYEISIYHSKINNISNILLFEIHDMNLSQYHRFIKRFSDIVFSLLFLILLSPTFLLSFIWLKLEFRGSVIEKTKLLTYNNRAFNQYRFKLNYKPNMAHTKENLLPFSSFVSLLKLTYLPELYNVLKGDMSFIGPRAESPEFIAELIKQNPEFAYRLNMRAGLTGLSQSLGFYDDNPDAKVRYDLFYIQNFSILRDLSIILITIKNAFLHSFDSLLDHQKRTLNEALDDKSLHMTFIEDNVFKVVSGTSLEGEETTTIKVVKFHNQEEYRLVSGALFLLIGEISFAGSYIIRKLLGMGFNVKVLITPFKQRPDIEEFESNPLFSYSLTNPLNYDELLKITKNPNYIIYLSELDHHNITKVDGSKEISILVNVLEALRSNPNLKKFLYISNSEIYGESLSNFLEERNLGNPATPYQINRQSLEEYVSLYHRKYLVPTIRLRVFDLFSELGGSSSAMSVFGLSLNELKKDNCPKIFVDPREVVCPLYIDDFFTSVLKSLTSGPALNGNVYNIAGSEEGTIESYYKMAATITKRPMNVTYLPTSAIKTHIKTTVSTINATRDLEFVATPIYLSLSKIFATDDNEDSYEEMAEETNN